MKTIVYPCNVCMAFLLILLVSSCSNIEVREQLAFQVGEFMGKKDIQILDLSSKDYQTVTSKPGIYGCPTWSPDGEQLAFVETLEDESYRIVIADIDATSMSLSFVNAPEGFYFGDKIDWSPNGDLIAAFMGSREDASGIYLIDPQTSRIEFLVSEGSNPHWSPDGKIIAYAVIVTWDQSPIYLVEVEDPNPVRFEENGSLHDWSPDGKRILFSARPDGNWNIFHSNIDGSDQVQITQFEGNWPSFSLEEESYVIYYAGVTWSPDKQLIAFSSNKDSPQRQFLKEMTSDLYLMDSNGENIVRLTNAARQISCPDWRPQP